MMRKKPGIIVFATGKKKSGGSGALEIVEFTHTDPPVLDAEIRAIISNVADGGVSRNCENLNKRGMPVPFEFWGGPFEAEGYQHFVKKYNADYVMLSGWLKLVKGLDPRRTVNIHPGPIHYGGSGMHGHHVHEALIRDYKAEKIKQSAVSVHFVDEFYDHGPLIQQFPVLIRPEDDADSLGSRVNEKERAIQSVVLNQVVHGEIRLEDGGDNWLVIDESKPLTKSVACWWHLTTNCD